MGTSREFGIGDKMLYRPQEGQIKDNYPLKEITLQLFKENECVYSLTFDSKYLGRKAGELMVEGSLYNWTVTVDSEQEPIENEIYINKLSELSPTEKHYLRMAVAVTDKAGNKTASSDSQLGFICLYQEADRPWIEVSSLETADKQSCCVLAACNSLYVTDLL